MKNTKNRIFIYLKNTISYVPITLAIVLAIAAAYRPLSLSKDILSDYSLITQDGFQWIMQGRALEKILFTEPWPQLRNPGYIAIAALDSLLGSQGIAISASILFALIVQIFVIYRISLSLNSSSFFAGSLAFAYLLNPIQFISLHVLSDAVSVALMFLMIYIAFLLIYENKKVNNFYIFSLSLTTALFQLYTLYPVILLIIFLIKKLRGVNASAKVNKLALFYLLFGLIIGLIIRQTWYLLIPHNSSPNQTSLININLGNLNFYLNTWGWLLAPIIFLSIIYLLFLRKNNFELKIFDIFIFTLTLSYAISIFFYDWQESRFSYFLVGIMFINLSIIVKDKTKNSQLNILGTTLITLTLIFGTVFTPTNKWAPQIGESVMWRPWILHGFWGSPPYAEYVAAKNKYCENGIIEIMVNENLIRNEMPLIANSDPNLGIFALKNCL